MGDGYNWADPKNAEHPESASIPLPVNVTPGKVPKTAIMWVLPQQGDGIGILPGLDVCHQG